MNRLWAAVLVCLLVVTACSPNAGGSDSDEKAAKNEITVWAWDPAFNIPTMEIAKERYSQKNKDVKINIVEYAQDDIIQKLNTAFNSGTTKSLPNIVLIEDYRAQSFLQAYPDMFFEMTSYIDPKDFAEYKLGPTSLDGKQYGVPFDTGVTGLYFRTDYLEQAGFSKKDMQNIDWKRYIEIGKKVKEKTGKNFLTLDPNDLGIIRMMIQTAGSWYVKEDGVTPNLADNEALKEAFQLYKEMMEADIVRIHSDWSQFVAGFNSGEVVTVPTGNWITPSIKQESSQSGQWAVAPIPKLPNHPKSVNASNLGGSSWYVLNIPGKETAADFLAETFGSDVEMYQQLFKEVGAIGTYTPAAGGEAYKQKDKFFGGQNIAADFASWTEKIPRVNYGMHTYAIEDILVVEMQNYLNGKDLDKALSDAQAQAESQIK